MNDENYYVKLATIHAYNDGCIDYFLVSSHSSVGDNDEGIFFTHKDALNYINHERSDLEYFGTCDNRED